MSDEKQTATQVLAVQQDRQALMRRFERACDLKQPIDRDRISATLLRWIGALSDQPMTVRFVETYEEAGRAAWDAWAAEAARAVKDARAARAARAASVARDAWAARAARAASVARDATWDPSYLATIIFGAAETGDDALFARWAPMLDVLEAGAFAFWITNDAIVVATLPRAVRVDEARRLHGDAEPAFDWLGQKDYWHHGVLMPSDVYEKPGALSVKRIDKEENAEVRRAMIALFGMQRYMSETKAKIIHEDDDPHWAKHGRAEKRRLLRRDLDGDPEPIVIVDVPNSSLEPDGSLRRYMIRVDPSRYSGSAGRECHAAIASTFRRKRDRNLMAFATPEDYAPQQES